MQRYYYFLPWPAPAPPPLVLAGPLWPWWGVVMGGRGLTPGPAAGALTPNPPPEEEPAEEGALPTDPALPLPLPAEATPRIVNCCCCSCCGCANGPAGRGPTKPCTFKNTPATPLPTPALPAGFPTPAAAAATAEEVGEASEGEETGALAAFAGVEADAEAGEGPDCCCCSGCC